MVAVGWPACLQGDGDSVVATNVLPAQDEMEKKEKEKILIYFVSG